MRATVCLNEWPEPFEVTLGCFHSSCRVGRDPTSCARCLSMSAHQSSSSKVPLTGFESSPLQARATQNLEILTPRRPGQRALGRGTQSLRPQGGSGRAKGSALVIASVGAILAHPPLLRNAHRCRLHPATPRLAERGEDGSTNCQRIATDSSSPISLG